jgi:putative transcriptional regulator
MAKSKPFGKQPEFGQLIREFRQEMGLTQEQFASFLGVVYPTINRWENGRAQPSPMALKLIETKLIEMGERGQELLQQHLMESGD